MLNPAVTYQNEKFPCANTSSGNQCGPQTQNEILRSMAHPGSFPGKLPIPLGGTENFLVFASAKLVFPCPGQGGGPGEA